MRIDLLKKLTKHFSVVKWHFSMSKMALFDP